MLDRIDPGTDGALRSAGAVSVGGSFTAQGVGLIGGEGSTFGASRPKQTAKGTLAAIAALDVDYVVADLGPADSTLMIDLWLGADVPVLVTLPDPASIDALSTEARERELRSIWAMAVLAALTLGVGFVVSLHVRRLLAPPARVTDRARAVARGDL